MRPPRVIIIGAVFVTATVLLIVSLRGSNDQPIHHSAAEADSHDVGSMAFSFFHAPFSLFPPNAIISLTDDNTTSFLARPAGFGPPLPTKGLSGQLWIGSGFGDDSIRQGVVTAGAEGELGCSDVPGWVDGNAKNAAASAEGAATSDGKLGGSANKHQRRSSGNGAATSDSTTWRPETFDPIADDGTDDYLHHPLPDSTLSKTQTSKQVHDVANLNSDHADIQSIQEGAEIAGKVVLLSRGGCGFLEKVKWVQRRGGIALIVGDNTRGGPLIQMYARGDTSNVTIPSVFTSRTTAHLLSSLMGPNNLLEDAVDKDGKAVTKTSKPKKGGKKAIPNIAPSPTHTLTAKAAATPVSKTNTKSPSIEKSTESKESGSGWFSSLFSGSKSSGSASDSRRPPSSGRLDWVLVDDWNEDQDKKSQSQTKDTSSTKDNQKSKSGTTAGDDFVIGVQDWRDPDLVGEPSKEVKGQGSKKSGTEKSEQNSQAAGSKQSTGASKDASKSTQDLKGGSITPGSGEYTPGNREAVPPKGSSEANQKSGLLYKFFGDDEDEAQAAGVDVGVPGKSMSAGASDSAGAQEEEEEEHEGVWVTLTQASGTSPFFDTLLVLVISPLVTLTVVYALLLLRSRIRRRRWRAPKSVVERLPVRTYHTVASSTSSGSSPRVPSPPGSSPSTPLLQPGRSRQRSQTISGPPEPSRSSGPSNEHEKGAGVSSEWKKFMGRQVECVVCLEEYVDGVSRVMSLPCGHEFHVDCITPWLTTRRRTCPICKGDVVRSLARGSPSSPRYDSYHDDSDDDIQIQAAETVNESPTAALPIGNMSANEDVEQGVVLPSPTRPSLMERTASWRTMLATSFGSSRSPPEDRMR